MCVETRIRPEAIGDRARRGSDSTFRNASAGEDGDAQDGSEILIAQGPDKPPRRLTPREWARLMGFDERFQESIVVSDTQAYRQFGNAVVPRVAEAVGEQIVAVLAGEWNRSDACLLKNRGGNFSVLR